MRQKVPGPRIARTIIPARHASALNSSRPAQTLPLAASTPATRGQATAPFRQATGQGPAVPRRTPALAARSGSGARTFSRAPRGLVDVLRCFNDFPGCGRTGRRKGQIGYVQIAETAQTKAMARTGEDRPPVSPGIDRTAGKQSAADGESNRLRPECRHYQPGTRWRVSKLLLRAAHPVSALLQERLSLRRSSGAGILCQQVCGVDAQASCSTPGQPPAHGKAHGPFQVSEPGQPALMRESPA